MKQASRLIAQRADVASALVVLIAWIVISEVWQPMWLPRLTDIGGELWKLITSGSLSFLSTTGFTLVMGLLVTFVIGGIIAALMASSATIEEGLLPFVNGFLSTPHIALIPMFTFIWGNSELTRIVTTVSFAISPVILTWSAALKETHPHLMEMASSFGANSVGRTRFVRLPGAVSPLIAGVRIGVMQGIKGVVSAEVIIGVVGIGKLITTASHTFNMPLLFAVVILIIVISVVVYAILTRIESAVTRWNA
ncbi:ABC transporter permease [Microbacterium sp. YY-01]|uniref:ABC transporter permease n=1 Tax=Microbacterium sp. YY-01 TaxID=3421634 RepID=UPI003D1766BC